MYIAVVVFRRRFDGDAAESEGISVRSVAIEHFNHNARRDASDDTTENKLEVDDREVACDEAAASPPSSLDIDGWRIG